MEGAFQVVPQPNLIGLDLIGRLSLDLPDPFACPLSLPAVSDSPEL